MDDQVIRELVFNKLTKAGWITGTWVKDVSPTQTQMRVNFTELGKAKLHAMYALFEELGYGSGYRVGELEFLHDLCHTCVRLHPAGPGEQPQEPPPR